MKMTIRSWSTARGARYFQAKDTTWSIRIRPVTARMSDRRKITASVLPINRLVGYK
jgi:hypothetical protein